MMWSENLRQQTLDEVYPGASMKSLDNQYGIYSYKDGKVVIYGATFDSNSYFPVATDEIIATFKNKKEMIDAGWVID